jgi:hypothetical protein
MISLKWKYILDQLTGMEDVRLNRRFKERGEQARVRK